MRLQNTRPAARSLHVDYTSRPMSGWGGLVAIARFFDSMNVRSYLDAALPDGRQSNNLIEVEDVAMQLFATVLTGGSRFDHAQRVKDDEVVREIFGAKRFGSPSAITTYFGNLTQSQSEHAHATMNALTLATLAEAYTSDVIDLDSTVFDRYGEQQGSSKGYNPRRPGARSHHPLLAMTAASKMIVHAWMRAGSASPRRGCCEFVRELFAQLPPTFRVAAIRADSGFYSDELFTLLEQNKVPYAIRMRLPQPQKRWCAGLPGWKPLGEDFDITEGTFRSQTHRTPRRVIVTREAIRRQVDGVLFEVVDYEYFAIVTSLSDPAEEVWRFYNGRGDCENRIKELKYDFNADGFCLRSFAGTETVFRLICFLFNAISSFRSVVLNDTKTRLCTLRHRLFVIGASIGSSARKRILRLGLVGRWKREFEKLLHTVSTWARLGKQPIPSRLESPSAWRLRTTFRPLIGFN